MNFKVGQKVVALSNPQNIFSQPRIKGHIYTVLDVETCSCGIVSINIHAATDNLNTRCSCGTLNSNYKWWTNSRHFAPIVSDQELLEYKLNVSIPELAQIEKPEPIHIERYQEA